MVKWIITTAMDEILFTFRYEHYVGALEQLLNPARKERFKEKKNHLLLNYSICYTESKLQVSLSFFLIKSAL